MRLQHALLSTLKNLVIPKVNKAAIIEAGLVETILPMLEIHTPPVVFKLLGTLRMMVDGQGECSLHFYVINHYIDLKKFYTPIRKTGPKPPQKRTTDQTADCLEQIH
jgi:hypothetical protein